MRFRSGTGLAVLVLAAVCQAAAPDPFEFGAGVRAGKIDPATFDFAAAGFWELDSQQRMGWPYMALAEPGSAEVRVENTCDPTDRRNFELLVWGSVAAQAADASEWRDTVSVLQANLVKLEARLENEAAAWSSGRSPLLAEMQRRFARDQAIRMVLTEARWTAGMSPRVRANWEGVRNLRETAIDCENTAWLKTQLKKVGWFDARKYGKEADTAAFFLVQHADREPEFQRQTLEALRKLPPDATSLKNVAYLVDRVERAAGRPQVYGTQWSCMPNGDAHLQDAIDPDHLDERRQSVGLEPVKPSPRLAASDCPQPVN